ncbi:MAG: hypothetical protein CME06_00580 [Gemmatimonadetes bacterium]|nr:hypothetical protein [Gemmatimonadota bacterium]
MEVAERLEKTDWARVGVQLVGYAAYLARSYRWGASPTDTIALGMAAEDVASLAIRKVWTGERCWAPERQPDLLLFLKGVVRSEMGHLYRRSAAQHEIRPPTGPDGAESEERLAIRSADTTESADPEVELIRNEERAHETRRIQELRDAVHDKPELAMIIDAIGRGCGERPRHLAAELSVSVSEINNRLKRLRRVALRVGTGVSAS